MRRPPLAGFLIAALLLWTLPSQAQHDHDHGAHGHEEAESSADHSGHDDDDDDHHEDHGAIELDERQRAAGGITLALAGPGVVRETLSLLGEVKLDQTRVVHIVPRVAGIATRVLRQAGDRVEKDELLAVLESPEIGEAKIAYISALLADELARLELDRQAVISANTAKMLRLLEGDPSLDAARKGLAGLKIGEDKAKLLGAYSRLAYARGNLTRERDLIQQQISSDQTYQEARRDFEVAQAEYQATEESIRFRYELDLAHAERKVKVADNSLHNARRRLLLLGVSETELAVLSEGHHHQEEHHGHDHLPMASAGTASTRPPTAVTDLDRHLAELSLRSPLAGLVLRRHLAPGERATPEDDAFLVGDLSTVWVDLAVYPEDLDRIRPGFPVTIRSRKSQLEARGEVAFVQPILDEAVRTGFARVVLDNPSGRWRPGLFVTGAVELGQGATAEVVLRRTAVIRQGNERIAFVLQGSRFEPRELRLGRQDATHVEVLEGIDPGETYAATGAFVLKAELARESLGEAGHSH